MKNNSRQKNFKIKKIAGQKIEELKKAESKLPIIPNTFTYVKIYQLANELYGMGQFALASDICDCTLKHLQHME